MKKVIQILFLGIAFTCSLLGQKSYNVALIADSLKENANAVIRHSTTTYNRTSAQYYTVGIHYVVTVLNPNGENAAQLRIHYDRNSKVVDVSGNLYDAKGLLDAKLKQKEIGDMVANSHFTLFSDHRIKYFSPAVSSYPYTVEYKYTVKHTGIVGLDSWMPQEWFDISTEYAKLIFKVSPEFDIKYRQLNHHFIFNSQVVNQLKEYTWETENLKAIPYEPRAPDYLDFMPTVILSPNEIKYEGTKGDFSSWESYGQWVNQLIYQRDQLPLETSQHIKSLTYKLTSRREEIEAVYKYMQSQTRYVNIALGIGGFQPILAKDVDEKGYGDCKALSNYTKALLKCAGIESFYTEIGASKYQEIKFTDFASANQTNHVILCVPNEGDSLWLECTNQNNPFGYINPHLQNRYALLIKPRGGELVKIPSYTASENSRISSITIDINNQGNANFNINSKYNNNQYSNISHLLHSSEKDQKNKLLANLMSSKTIEINSFSLTDKSKNSILAELNVEGKVDNFTSISGSRMFFKPEFFHRNTIPSYISDKRELDIYEALSYSCSDTLKTSIPADYTLEYIHKDTLFESVYGNYSFETQFIKQTLTIVRKLTINQGTYGPESFEEINEFLRNAYNCENKKILISKKDV